MTDLPKSPDLLELPTLWRDWLRKLDNEQIGEARKRIVDWELKEHGIKLSALERIETMIEKEIVRRFAGMVEREKHLEDRIKMLEGALALAHADLANLPLPEVR